MTHLLATRTFIGRDRATLLAGIAPDLAFYSTYPLWVLRCGRVRVVIGGRVRVVIDGGAWPVPPLWMVQLHRAGHSIPVALFGALLIRLSSGRWPSHILSAYLLHLLIDIPTHPRHPWGPRPLWPFSDIAYDGVGWAEALTHTIQSWWRIGAQTRKS